MFSIFGLVSCYKLGGLNYLRQKLVYTDSVLICILPGAHIVTVHLLDVYILHNMLLMIYYHFNNCIHHQHKDIKIVECFLDINHNNIRAISIPSSFGRDSGNPD